MSDRDELTRLRTQVETLQNQLADMQTLAALGELVSTTTHEFNNVLMTVINYAQMGMRHQDQAMRDKCFDKIYAAGNRAAKITKTVLGMARNRSAGQEPTDLVELIECTLLLLERELNKYRIRVQKKFDEVPEVLVNGNQIQQVILNLVINARQAMKDGGEVRITIGYNEPDDMVELMIRDYGCGIPANKLPHIFDSFYSTKDGPDESGKGGTGLGLAMCKDVLEAHHGQIRVASTPGKGTAFTLRIPSSERGEELRRATKARPVALEVGSGS